MVISFSLFVFRMEKEIISNFLIINENIKDKETAIGCAALINYYYANSGGELRKNLDCEIKNGIVFKKKQKSIIIPIETKIIENFEGKKIFIDVEKHYG